MLFSVQNSTRSGPFSQPPVLRVLHGVKAGTSPLIIDRKVQIYSNYNETEGNCHRRALDHHQIDDLPYYYIITQVSNLAPSWTCLCKKIQITKVHLFILKPINHKSAKTTNYNQDHHTVMFKSRIEVDHTSVPSTLFLISRAKLIKL